MHVYGYRDHKWTAANSNAQLSKKTHLRVRLLLGQDVDETQATLTDLQLYGLGRRRTLDNFIKYTGLAYTDDRKDLIVNASRCHCHFDYEQSSWLKDDQTKNEKPLEINEHVDIKIYY